jgi:hypothetical protein
LQFCSCWSAYQTISLPTSAQVLGCQLVLGTVGDRTVIVLTLANVRGKVANNITFRAEGASTTNLDLLHTHLGMHEVLANSLLSQKVRGSVTEVAGRCPGYDTAGPRLARVWWLETTHDCISSQHPWLLDSLRWDSSCHRAVERLNVDCGLLKLLFRLRHSMKQ